MVYFTAPVILTLHIGWKLRTRSWRIWIPVHEMDFTTDAQMAGPGNDDKTVSEWL